MSILKVTDDDDVFIDEFGRLVVVTDKLECAAVKLKNRFRLFLGEWFLDTRIGVPWFQVVFVKNPDLSVIRRLLNRIILSVPPIITVTKLDLDYDPAARVLGFSFEAVGDDGRILTGGSGEPFIVVGELNS